MFLVEENCALHNKTPQRELVSLMKGSVHWSSTFKKTKRKYSKKQKIKVLQDAKRCTFSFVTNSTFEKPCSESCFIGFIKSL